MPFNTRNPIPSGDLRDLDDNARNIDTWANDKTKLSHPDRFGVERYTWHGIEQKAQLNIQQAIDAKNAAQEAAMMSGFSKYADTLAQLEAGIGTDYIEGDVVMVFQDETRGDTSSIFKIESGAAEFKLTFDNKTRQDLLSFTGNISADAQWSDVPAHSDPAFDVQVQALAERTEYLKEKTESLSVKDIDFYGAKGDGVTNDDAAFAAIEAAIQDQEVDLKGRAYAVSNFPSGNKYTNGRFVRGAVQRVAAWGGNARATVGNTLVGVGVAPNVGEYDPAYALFAFGQGCLANAGPNSRQQIAIGRNVLRDSASGFYNVGIGLDALYSLNGTSGDNGTRVVAIGDNAMRFSVQSHNCVAIGRNALHTHISGEGNTAIGSNAMSGSGPVGLDGSIINQSNSKGSENTAIGFRALSSYKAWRGTAVGYRAGQYLKTGDQNVLVGRYAGLGLESHIGLNLGLLTSINQNTTFTQTGNSIVIDLPSHPFVVNDYALLRFASGYDGSGDVTLKVTSVTDNSITVQSPVAKTITGAVIVQSKESGSPATTFAQYNVGIGCSVFEFAQTPSNNVAIGQAALKYSNGINNVGIGFGALEFINTGYNNTAIGRNAGRLLQDGSNAESVIGSTAIGFGSRVSGSGQIQLGDTGTTVYAYGAVQDRSDARDKADVRDTVLGLEFIKDLRAVDFKWDMRDDYVLQKEDGSVEVLPKDGSKKRNRYHHGLIAQELREVMERHGVDFGGLQDHSVNGGCDVLSIGYTELIAPLIKAVQELSARVEDLEAKLTD